MTEGLILKGIGGYYSVLYNENNTCTLKARGKFRVLAQTPLPGDRIMFSEPYVGVNGSIGEILPRKNELIRPRVANIDILFVVICAQTPQPDWNLMDILCANSQQKGIRTICVMNKSDIASKEMQAQFLEEYAPFDPICISALTGEGIDRLAEISAGNICCFAGQSGAGKSSIVNKALGRVSFETGKLSKRTSRGKHTTRHAELVPCDNGAILVDTPGFSLMEVPMMPPEEFGLLYPEFSAYRGLCKFYGCLHDSEPSCAVKAASECGHIPIGRYKRYQALMRQIQQKWRNRYE